METLRIIQFCPSYPPYIGGVEYVVKSLSEWLVKLGHEVYIHTLDPSGRLPSKQRIRGVEVFRHPALAPNNAYYICFPWILDKLQIETSDVLHIHNIHAIYSLFVLVQGKHKRLENIVLSPYYHGYGHSRFRNSLWNVYRPIASKLIKQVNTIHAVSKLEAKLIEAHFSRYPVVIENGVDDYVVDNVWFPREDKVLYAGRIEKYKRIARIAELIKILNENYGFHLRFTIIGRGPYRKKLKKRLCSAGVEHRLLPFLPKKEYVAELSSARLFTLLSAHESFPQSVNEAHAIGTPVAIAEPWGSNFRGRNRTLTLNMNHPSRQLASQLNDFLVESVHEPRTKIPTWEQVVKKEYIQLYETALSC